MPLPPLPPAHIRPALPPSRPQLAARAQASPRVQGVPLDALRGRGEARFLGPGGTPRLVPVAPFNAKGAPIVFIHGILGDPADEEVLIRDAQSRGMQVWVMAYDTIAHGAKANATGFAEQMRQLGNRGVRDVTVVTHSLGGMTFKAALDRLTDAHGKLTPFEHVRFVALSSPWGGVSAADSALMLLTRDPRLAFARDLAPDGAFWQQTAQTSLSKQVSLYVAHGDRDQVLFSAWGSPEVTRNADALLAQARRQVVLGGDAHNSILWDPRTAAFVFDPADSPAPKGRAPLWQTIAGETAAVLKRPGAFRGNARGG